jgi:hypothetical protein
MIYAQTKFGLIKVVDEEYSKLNVYNIKSLLFKHTLGCAIAIGRWPRFVRGETVAFRQVF